MEYSNPELPEGINASQEHPLKEFMWLTASILAATLVLLLLAIGLADAFADRIPFRVERAMTEQRLAATSGPPPLEAYLNTLAGRIAAAQGLPEEMTLRVHYLEGDTVNAFATLGGNIYLLRGLLEKLPNENALAMVLAHEIAHVKHRDPIRGVGRAVVIGLILSMLSGDAGNAVLDRALSQGATLTILDYSRDQERAADDAALATLTRMYGHLRGADTLFAVLAQEHPGAEPLEFFSSHPLIEARLAKVHRSAGPESESGATTALPEGFAQWLAKPPCAAAEAGSAAASVSLERGCSEPRR